MIGRKNRFHGRGGLRQVYARGQNVRGPLMSLKVMAGKPGTSYRAAVVVSKKVSKSAVVRNRIRRRLYEVIRLSPLVGTTYDVIVTVYSEQVADLPTHKLQQMFETQLTQADISNLKTKN